MNKAVVNANVLNVRSGSGTSFPVIAQLKKSTEVEIIEVALNGWKKIKTSSGLIGWVSGSYLTIVKEKEPIIQAIVTANKLNVREGSSTKYSVITVLDKSTVVEVLETALNGWKKIKTSEGLVGWVSGSYLTIVKEKEPITPYKVQAVIDLAKKQLGKPYGWGDEGPNSFDCSGLMYYIFKNAANIILPRTSSTQYNVGIAVSKSDLQIGDLIFFSTAGTGRITHVAIYIGDSKMIHAPRIGRNVEIANMNTNFWNKAYIGARRVLL